MRNFKSLLRNFLPAAFASLALCFTACGNDDDGIPGWPWEDNTPDTPDTPAQVEAKPRFIWIDAAANFPEYANSKENIERDLQKAKDAGFTDIVVDVRPTMGDVLFNTNVVDQVHKLDYWEGSSYKFYERTADWDYLQEFIDAGHRLGLRVNASINTFVGGNKYPYGLGEQGLLFRDADKKDWATTLNLSDGLTNVMDITEAQDENNLTYGTRFLNPANDDVQEFLLNLIGDLAKYNVDGIFLDRCRYNDIASDFSDITRRKFEEYIGEHVENFPGDILEAGSTSLPSNPSELTKKWLEFRVKTIHDFIEKVRARVKSVNPDLRLGTYVGAWYSDYYDSGVNWASPKYDTSAHYSWATPDYKKYGYADLLDFMLVGAYASADAIYGSTEWTMQGFAEQAKQLLMNDVKFAAGPDVGNSTGWTNGGCIDLIPKTVDACINAADGYFVFDMIHVREYNYWDGFKQGFDSYLNSLKENK